MGKKAIIIGAGPAGLTAAWELLKRTDIKPVILEKSGDIGGLSKTVNYKGNRMDMGPHRFFSKSDRVMDWWLNIMPLQATNGEDLTINYQNKSRNIPTGHNAGGQPVADDPTKSMLVIKRLTRIYFLRRFFAYPVQLSVDTLRKLGPARTMSIMWSYMQARLFPRKPERSLEDFLINRFGKRLYLLFFKDYTEKVWGISCKEISAEWGAQRIKGVSISKAIGHAIQSGLRSRKKTGAIGQKGTETSLIEQFLYPPLGAGQMWEEVARQVQEMGGEIFRHCDVKEVRVRDEAIVAVEAIDNATGQSFMCEGDYFFSTMPVQELIAGLTGDIGTGCGSIVPANVKEVAAGLQYRDFVNVGVLLKKLSTYDPKTGEQLPLTLTDSWLYIQDRNVMVGRIQVYNNWGPHMVQDPDTVWIGMEYFCNKEDAFWQQENLSIKLLAIEELGKIGLAVPDDVLDLTVQRMEKTYPAYFGTYDQFDVIKNYINRFKNLFLVGRNGMHKYNNTDHSMLTAMVAVDNICDGVTTKANLWEINTEQEYHEEKANAKQHEEAPNVREPRVSVPSPAVAAPVATLILAFLFGLSACMSHPAPPPKTGLEGKSMPGVNLLLADSSTYFNTKNIPEGQSTVLFYFSPSCPYCRAQMTEMTKNIDELKNVRLYVMTFSRFKDFKSFYDEFKVKDYPNITAGLDYTDSMGHYFKLKSVPFTAVYNPEKKLTYAFPGRISVEQIKAAAKE